MLAAVTSVGALLTQASKLMENKTVKESVKSVVGWMKGLFKNNKRAKERLELIEQGKANEEAIKGIQSSLDDALYGNEELIKEFETKIKEMEEKMKEAGITTNINKTNTMNITGNNNVGLNDISGNSNINLNINK